MEIIANGYKLKGRKEKLVLRKKIFRWMNMFNFKRLF